MADILLRIGKTFDVDLDVHHARARHFLVVLFTVALIAGALVVFLTPWKAFALVVGLLFVGFAFYKPEEILLFLAVYIPFEPFLLKFISDDVYIFARYFSEGLIYVLLVSVLARMCTGRKRFVATPLDLPFIFFLLVVATSLIINAVPVFTGLLGLRQIIRFILLFFLTVYLDPSDRFIRQVTKIMLGVVLLEGIIGIVQAFVGAPLDEFLIPSERKYFESIQLTSGTTQFWSPGSRVFATMGRFDQLGTFLSFFFLIGTGLLYQIKDKLDRRWLMIAIGLSIPAFIMTLSRASWFGFVLGLIVIGAVLMKDWRVRIAIVAAIGLSMMYLAYTGIAVRYLIDTPEQTPVERLFEAFSYERWRGEYIGLGRVFWVVQTPLVVIRSSPLFGVGPGMYGGGAVAALGNTRVYEKLNLPFGVYGSEGYIDNNWFSLWGETGTLGVGFYAWMIFLLAFMAFRTWQQAKDPYVRGLALGFLGAVIAVSFQAFLATYFEVRTLALYLWLYGAFVFVMARREKINFFG